MRTVVLRVAALALLLLLALVAVITMRTLQRVPDTVIYFLSESGPRFTIAPAYRNGAGRRPADLGRRLVRALADGPTPDEAARGLSSAVPADTEVRSESLENGIMTIDLNAAFERGGGSASMIGRLNQLYYTLTQPLDVKGVVLKVEGKTVEAFGGEGVLVPVPWLRVDEPDHPTW